MAQQNNPFYVEPAMASGGRGLGQGMLQGFRAAQQFKQDQRAEETHNQEREARAAYQAAMASKDPALMRETMAQYPEYAKVIQDNLQFTDDESQAVHQGAYTAMYKNPERSEQILIETIKRGEGRGVDMTESREDLRKLQSGEWSQEDMRKNAAIELQMSPGGLEIYDGIAGVDEEMENEKKRFDSWSKLPDGPRKSAIGEKYGYNAKGDYSQVTDMPGYAFDNDTGTFKFDPTMAANMRAEAERLAASGDILGSKDIASVNDKVTTLTKPVLEIQQAATDLKALKADDSSASKMAAVFKFMKAMDPSSSVRESEQGQVYAAGGSMSQLAGYLNSLAGQGGLTDAVFSELVQTATVLADSAIGAGGDELDAYLKVLEGRLPPDVAASMRARLPTGEPAVDDTDPGAVIDNQNLPRVAADGWTLETDANGNRAYVSPDRKQFREIPRS